MALAARLFIARQASTLWFSAKWPISWLSTKANSSSVWARSSRPDHTSV